MKKLVSAVVGLALCFSFAFSASAAEKVGWTANMDASYWVPDNEGTVTIENANGGVKITTKPDADPLAQRTHYKELVTVNLDETPILKVEVVEKNLKANLVIFTEDQQHGIIFFPNADYEEFNVGTYALNIPKADPSGFFTGEKTFYVGVWTSGAGASVTIKDLKIVSETADAPAAEQPAAEQPAAETPAAEASAAENPKTGDNGIAMYIILAAASVGVMLLARKKLFAGKNT